MTPIRATSKKGKRGASQYRLEIESSRAPTELLAEPQWPHLDAGFPPNLTFGPNPNFGDLIDVTAPVPVGREPYSHSIAAGKNSYVYDAHTYHTKVPPQGIQLLIEHFTDPNATVLDPFCGSGMTGVAAREAGRRALLSDLSPAAAFISYNHTTPIDAESYLRAIFEIVARAELLERELYTTDCRECGAHVPILYMVWSYGVECSHCGTEIVIWDVARDEKPSVRESKIRQSFDCPHCQIHIAKRGLKRTRLYPVQVGYKCCSGGTQEQTSPPSKWDLSVLGRIAEGVIPEHLWYPTNRFPDGVNTRQPVAAGLTSVDKVYTKRALWMMAQLWNFALRWPEPRVRSKLLFTITSLYQRVTLFSEFRFWGGSGNTANYNVPVIINEQNVLATFSRKARTISWYFKTATKNDAGVRVGVQSATCLAQLPDNSVDYVFTDPPFGANINYSEMNFLWESWLRVFTNTADEAIVNKFQLKGIDEYSALLRDAFKECRRVLKPNAWLTVVFHNSASEVWRALQRAVTDSGFVIGATQTFDKKHGTFKQFVSENAVGYDLVLHCQKIDSTVHALTPTTVDPIVFVRNALADGSRYRTHFLHVARPDEFDYRRLYADWLTKTVAVGSIGLSFEEFRAVVDAERSNIA